MSRRVAIIDYGIGNVRSIANAVRQGGGEPLLTAERREILAAGLCILPGVGAFAHGMANLHQRDLAPVIFDYLKTGKCFIGICLGMQMLMDYSLEFGRTSGLGILPGSVEQLAPTETTLYKLPHINWARLKEPTQDCWEGTLLQTLSNQEEFYFVHSYAARPRDPNHVLAVTEYGGSEFCSAVQKENVYGFQFHPEKSAVGGLKILARAISGEGIEHV